MLIVCRRIRFGLSRFTIALGGYKLHLNYKNDPTKMKGVQGCADHNYHESDRISRSFVELGKLGTRKYINSSNATLIFTLASAVFPRDIETNCYSSRAAEYYVGLCKISYVVVLAFAGLK